MDEKQEHIKEQEASKDVEEKTSPDIEEITAKAESAASALAKAGQEIESLLRTLKSELTYPEQGSEDEIFCEVLGGKPMLIDDIAKEMKKKFGGKKVKPEKIKRQLKEYSCFKNLGKKKGGWICIKPGSDN